MSARRLTFGEWKSLLVKTYQEWSADQAPRLGAALAYYTVLSLAPLLILLIAVAGLVFGDEAASGRLFAEIRNMVGTDGAKAIEEMVQNASKPGHGIIASLIGFATLLFGASSVAAELKNSLNAIWNKDPNASAGIKDMVKQRSQALIVVLGCGFLLLVSLAVSSTIAAAGTFMTNLLPVPEFAMQMLNLGLGILVITGVFAALFRYLPDVSLQWKDVLLGAAFTAVLFAIGKVLMGLYLGKASFGSAYGAAGSLVIVLVWVYYSSQIMFFGAEFTQVYTADYGSDPHGRRSRPRVESAPAAAELAPAAASGNSSTTGDRATGLVGTILGSALALTKVIRGVKR